MVAPAKGSQAVSQQPITEGPQPQPQETKPNKKVSRGNVPDFREWEVFGQLRIGGANVGPSDGKFLVFPKVDNFGFLHIGGVFGFVHDVNKGRARVGLGATAAIDSRVGDETTFGSKFNVFSVNAAAQLSLRYLTTLPGKANFLSLLPYIRVEGGGGLGWGDTAIADIGTSTFEKKGPAGRLSVDVGVAEFFRIWSLGLYMSATKTGGQEGDIFTQAGIADRHIGFQTTVRLGKATVNSQNVQTCDKVNDEMYSENWRESTGDKELVETVYLPKLKESKLIAEDAKRTDVTPAYIDRLIVVDEAVMSLLKNPEVKLSKDQLKLLRSNLMLSPKSLEEIRKTEGSLINILPEGLSPEDEAVTSKTIFEAIDNSEKIKAQWDQDELKVYDKDSQGKLHNSKTEPEKALAMHLQERRKANMGAKEVCADASEIQNLDDILDKINDRLNDAVKNGDAIDNHKISKDKIVMDSTFVTLREVYFTLNRPSPRKDVARVDAFEALALKKYQEGKPASEQEIIDALGDWVFTRERDEVAKLIETAQGLLKEGSVNQNNLEVSNQDALEYVQQNKDKVVIGINAYTDSRGDAEYNEKLSELRARVVRAIFISQGINPDSLVAIGRGEGTIAEGISSEDARRKGLNNTQRREAKINAMRDNRRVVLTIHESIDAAKQSKDPSLADDEDVIIDD